MKIIHRFLPLILFLLVNICSGKTFYISSVKEYNANIVNISLGDTIIWKNGLYENQSWEINRSGLKIFAEDSGSVIFTGKSFVIIKADSVLFSGFQFKDGSILNNVVEISGSQNRILNLNIINYQSLHYLNIQNRGTYNTVEYCNFENKPPANKGAEPRAVLLVDVESPAYNTIRYCSFKNHYAPTNTSQNYSVQAVRIGGKVRTRFMSRTLVEYCFFTECNGDEEIISDNAGQNVFRYNTFDNNGKSHFTLNGANENIIYGNFFMNGAGLLLNKAGSTFIYNNYFSTGNEYSIRILKSGAIGDTVYVAFNSFVNSGKILFERAEDDKRESVQIVDNLFSNMKGELYPYNKNDAFWSGNIADETSGKNHEGVLVVKSTGLAKNNNKYYQLTKGSPSIDNAKSLDCKMGIIEGYDTDPFIKTDIMGNERPSLDSLRDVGCFEYTGTIKIKPRVTDQETGPGYLKGKKKLADPGSKIKIDNPFVRVMEDSTACGRAFTEKYGKRIIVAISDVYLKGSKGDIKLSRGGVSVFMEDEYYEQPSGNYFEVALKKNHPPLSAPEKWIEPLKNKIVYDDDEIRVFEERLDAGDLREEHSHAQRVVIRFNRAKLTDPRFYEEGLPGVGIQIPNTVVFAQPVVHVIKNVSKIPLFNIVIEFKFRK